MTLSLHNRKERGISLVEALIVLSIFAILVAAIWATASTAFNNQKKRTLQEQTIQIVNNIKGLFQGQQASSSTGFGLTQAIAAGVFPSDMIVSRVAPLDVRHPYATSTAVDVTSPAAGQIQLALGTAVAGKGLPQDACVELASRLAGTAEGANRIGLVSIAGPGSTILAAAFPVKPSDAVLMCNASGSTNYLQILFAVP